MERELKKAYTWEIDNIAEKSHHPMSSDRFFSGGCPWNVSTTYSDGHISVCLIVREIDNLKVGFKIKAKYCFVVSNETGKELYGSPEISCSEFCEEVYYSTSHRFSLNELHEKGFMEKNKLTIQVYMNVSEIHTGISEVDMLDCYGFKVLGSQVNAVCRIFLDHPDIINVEDFRSKNDVVKSAYIYVLLDLIETLKKHPERLSDTVLSNAHRKLSELTEADLKLDWLVTKLEDAKKKKSQAHKLLEERIKDLKLAFSDLKDKLEKMKSAADKKI